MAAPFDVGRREVGGPVTLVEDVMQAANVPRPSGDSGAGQFAVAGGALVYASGGVAPQTQSELVWVDRISGNVEPLGFSARGYVFPRLSPDGKRLTFFNTGANRRIWMYDFARRTVTPLTPPEERGAWAIWMDDERIVFSSFIRGAGLNLSTRRVTDSGPSERLTTGRRSMRPAATFAPPLMPGSTPTGCGSSRSCWRRSARQWPGSSTSPTSAASTR